ncbi:MAG: putative lipid II flippase FtsW [Gammaproteobacteria bacterium]|nr:putative lipid II flippase FtsW [Gammaproteobacteria bacterium]NNF62475.1 putative lipid II flippase FtsW [Gammaproteobacteria bacterium]NNM21827.1 putative lipid II flippase FtsW [Gammaproteobacteria bacterium]
MSAARTYSQPWRVAVDPVLGSVVAALLLIGLVMVASSSVAIADRDLAAPFYYLNRQLLLLLIGLGAGGVALVAPTRLYEKSSVVLPLIALLLLVIVLLPGVGHTVNGSTRWLPLGPVRLQVSEPVRLLLLMYIAGYIVRRHQHVRETLGGFVKPMLLITVACTLLLAEPDFGAAAVLLGTVLAVMFIGGVRWRDLFLLVTAAGVSLAALALTSPYRLQRLTTFLDPWADPFNSGFQLTQSLIAVGRGGLFGVGLGGSVQKLFYLPEAHTDFVFAVLAEELGLIGAVGVILLFVLLVWRCFAIARAAGEAGLAFQSYLVYGISIWLGSQAFINIGVSLGALPTKGLTLPLISYGGSSLAICCIALALVLRVHHETVIATRAASPRRPATRRKGRR